MERLQTIGSIVLGNPGWLGVVTAIVLPFLLFLTISAWRTPLPARWKWEHFGLKALVVLLLAIFLLDPLILRNHIKPGENIVVMLADNSASMTMRQSPDSEVTRGEWTKRLLTDIESPWQVRLAQDFDLRRYTFGPSIARVEGFEDLEFAAPASNLGAAQTTLIERFRDQPLAAIFVLSDGNSTDALSLSEKNAGVPVFPIWNEDQQPVGDLSIENVSVSQTNFEDSPVSIQARIAANGDLPSKIEVTLEPFDNRDPAQRQTMTLVPESHRQLVARFQVKPPKPGPLFYRVAISSTPGTETLTEATLANNQRLAAVNRDAHVYRILYIAGRPNWELKFLGRALADDDRLQLVSLVRIARKEAKFDFRGRVGESSNSLFRGFKDKPDEETEAYDQAVLVRLNTRDADELNGGFPKTKADLYEYDAVILDDIESEFFTHDQLTLLDQFVSERGGGLLMLGGRDSFRHGKWNNTPVADALPVYLHRAGEPAQGEFRWQLTREGWLEPWMRVRDTEQAEELRQEENPSLSMVNATGDIKPGARILADVTDANGQHSPALVIQQYGRGRAGALLIGDLWKWSMQQKDAPADDPGKYWRQVVRWLTGDIPKRLEAVVEPTSSGGVPAMAIQVRVRDKDFQPEDGARVNITVSQPDGTEVILDAQPSLKEAGLFEAVHVARLLGPYVSRITVPGTDQEAPRQTELGWTSDPTAEEFKCPDVNRKLLERIASETGGEVVPRSRLDKFVADLGHRDLPVMETETVPLWHRPWMLLAILGLLALEWGLRRTRGLA